MNACDTQFFERRSKEGEIADAILSTVFPVLLPRTVVDLGTAVGTWLNAAKRAGAERVMGVDGPWVPAEQRLISSDEFVEVDLEGSLPNLGTFDLAICTEVLEHVSAPASERAVEWLCQSAPAVLFSAAVPAQGGEAHINERWQSHWAELFEAKGFGVYDVVRPKIWGQPGIPFWYQQNLFLMVRRELGAQLGLAPSRPSAVDAIHPALYQSKLDRLAVLEARSLKNRAKAVWRLFS